MQLPPGITILFGPSGAGKSTLLDCLAGFLRPDQGRIAIGGKTLFDSQIRLDLPPHARGIGYVFQSLALFPHLSVEENAGYGLAHLSRLERESRIAAALQAFRITALRRRKPREISGGEQQRVALARSLVTAPRLLLLDEPLSGLDMHLKSAIMQDLKNWNLAQNIPILYVTHSRDEVDALGERVIALEGGRIVSEGTPAHVLDAPRRETIAQLAGFENLLDATVIDLREADGVMRVRLAQSACELEVPLGHANPGDTVRIAIRAGDILLATQRPVGLSARNVLSGTLVSLEPRGTMIIARADCAGANLVVHLTPGALRTLQLETRQSVWLVLKTHSCHLVAD